MPFDTVPDVVRRRMARIRKADSRPEMAVRRIAHRLGYRFRLHRRDLPGTPDLVFPRFRRIVFVHGCFWHQHECRLGKKQPATRREYWSPKLGRNVARDSANREALEAMGWRVLTLWECEIADEARTQQELQAFMEPPLLSAAMTGEPDRPETA